MTACDDYPFGGFGFKYGQWKAMTEEIDSLRTEVDRLENDIDGHQQYFTCRPDRRREP